ncbi:iron-siderophore ABC transporter substrate-binding protein [Rhizobium deserti]|uniref:Iron-siderophore ABC transporter substrate-binding protein n=1 Tax=Rhizobium deserti TaxID=2547961 RepID=A0A4V3APZ7_9HYPH|nr:ABC transporter substrate-binding protein [Rhizobium deserti]TDK39750.1 iron-siderophore ABC transporter substrate-binding protein [Rhizobium deserti]
MLLTGAASVLTAGSHAWARSGPRVATLDWALMETLLAIGANLVAGSELRQFRQVAVLPNVPDTVADLGLRGSPNLELLHFVKPDVIFNSNFYQWADPLMSAIAPVESHSVYQPGQSPYDLAMTATLALGERLERPEAERLVHDLAGRLHRHGGELRQGDGRPILLINLGDARHYRVFGADSMFGEVLARLGLVNAWTGATSYSAMAQIGVETLASMPDAWIVLIPPHPQDALKELTESDFWNALPPVRENRVLTLGSVNPYGALPAAGRFADLLTEGLAHAWNG